MGLSTLQPDFSTKKETSMKKLMIGLLSLTFLTGMSVFAQNSMFSAGQDQMAPAPSAPLMTLKGTIKADGDKYTFVNDKDGKSWDVKNPEALKGHEGHHVQLSAHVYADQNQIHVMSVKMLKAQ
jgi:hypothetical protein